MAPSLRTHARQLEQVAGQCPAVTLASCRDGIEVGHQTVWCHELAGPNRVADSTSGQRQVGPDLDQVRNGPLCGQSRQPADGNDLVPGQPPDTQSHTGKPGSLAGGHDEVEPAGEEVADTVNHAAVTQAATTGATPVSVRDAVAPPKASQVA
jgi:hypothetical protein